MTPAFPIDVPRELINASVQYLKPSNTGTEDRFGNSVAFAEVTRGGDVAIAE